MRDKFNDKDVLDYLARLDISELNYYKGAVEGMIVKELETEVQDGE